MGVTLSLVVAYLLGSTPFAYLISKLKGVDIRQVGDHNVGSVNVFRHVGLMAGIITLVADIGKGALATVVARALGGEWLMWYLAGGTAIAGHNWPLFLRFRGGRGVGPTIGVLLILLPREMSITLGLAAVPLFVTRNLIWCGMVLFIPLPLLCWLFGEPISLLAYSMALPCLSGFAHWLTTRHLPPEARGEADRFWIASEIHHEERSTDKSL